MNDLLQKHGCANVFSIPEGLKELMSDVTREVLREQPPKIYDFISNYLSVLLITREHGIMAVKIMDDLCDCRPSVSEHLIQLGLQIGESQILSQIIKEEIEGFQPSEGKETIKEYDIIKKILKKIPLDEVMAAKVCQVARNAFRDYWYRKQTMEKLKIKPKEPWDVAAQRTLELYKRTKPSPSELARATEKIQAAYRGYYVRRNLLRHLRPKSKKKSPKVNLPGPPLDVAASREIDLGPLINIKVREDNINAMFDDHVTEKLGLHYDPMTALTHVPDEEYVEETDYPVPRDRMSRVSETQAQIPITSSLIGSNRSRPPSAVPSQTSDGKRQSRLPSQADTQRSHGGSKTDATETIQKISFSEVPPEVFSDDQAALEGDGEIKEVLAPESVEPLDTEVLEAEIPEDITDDRIEDTEGDESAPIETIPSSAPETANTTDIEDEAAEDLVDTEEEG
ncbi:uncharacterized protein LOC124534887 [Vanessa cardui]|uniref:uncharacterized protein LOC124534887 n=1 Tax=Vanessa cardui TaxID=171605 RepID=UPI001F13CA75|nr:uncharacterized protein LOC124534887 [Vanessa cardui]